jgi:glycosyltransferase involved in cell wall biosynthesis
VENGKIMKVREKFGINRDYLIFVGQLHKRKGVDDLVRAMRGINYLCVIVGEGPEKRYLTNLVEELGLGNVVLTGAIPREELISLYLGSTVFVLPSTAEALPLTILEAMSSGLPVVSTRVGAIPEIIKNDVNGKLIQPHDVSGLEKGIKFLISNPEIAEKMGLINKLKAEQEFDWRVTIQKIIEYYRTVPH